MKIFGLLFSLLVVISSYGQKSYYFSDPLPSESDKIAALDKNYFGFYRSENIPRTYEINAQGIFIISTNISSMSRSAIRESSQYSVRGNYIFGVVKDDSLPCVLEGENYFFGVRNRDVLIGSESKNLLTKLSTGRYVLNHFENGVYTPSLFIFEGKTLRIEEFEYDLETTIFDSVEKQNSTPSEHFDLVILSPTKDEFSALARTIFSPSATFERKRK